MAKKADKPKVAEAAGTTSNKKAVGTAMSIEDAMSKAAAEAQAEGVTDPDEIRDRMLAARDAVTAQEDEQP